MRVEPIGFGLSAIKIAMITEDEEGSGDKIEGLFAGIAGIDRAEIESLNRMLERLIFFSNFDSGSMRYVFGVLQHKYKRRYHV